MSAKVMKLIDSRTGLMECKVCGTRHSANIVAGGRYQRGSWQCANRCRPPKRQAEDSVAGQHESIAV